MNIEDKLNPHLKTIIDLSRCERIESVNPLDLFSTSRIDLAAKLIYAEHRAIGVEDIWAKKVYSEHLKVWNQFKEGDGSGKETLDDYIQNFKQVLDSIEEEGFNSEKTLVPVGVDNVIIDGSHRVAACIHHNKDVETVAFNYTPMEYSSSYFKKLYLDPSLLDSMILKYCEEKKAVKIAVLFPIATDKAKDVLSLISECGEILYEKDLTLTQRGKANLVRLLYEGEEWLGGIGHDTPGVLHHTLNRFKGLKPVKFIFFESNEMSNTLIKKNEIRKHLGFGNDSLHINDYHSQTIDLAEIILQKNGVNWLNHALSIKTPDFDRLFEKFKALASKKNADIRNYCLDGSAVLALYGIRDVNDLDYLVYGKDELDNQDEEISNHNEELIYHCCSLKELIYDPENYLYWKGVKFVSLDKIRCLKVKRAESKDEYDVKKIDALNESFSLKNYLLLELRYGLRLKMNTVKYMFINWMKKMIPLKLRPYFKKIYNFPNYIIEMLGPTERKIKYRGYVVHYSKGTSLIERIRMGQSYEPQLTNAIKLELEKIEHPVFIDIGANIGLMSLNILQAFPDIKIYAFEPGMHQADYFVKTIEANNLNKSIILNRFALGNKSGEVDFSVHSTRHASGDGFFDTGRAGKTKTIKVPVRTLDDWWIESGKPVVNVIKIDTEGAELWIFEGASILIGCCQPIVFLEIHPVNLKPYPYNAIDIYSFWSKNNYRLMTLAGDIVDQNNMLTYLKQTQDFIASPIQGAGIK